MSHAYHKWLEGVFRDALRKTYLDGGWPESTPAPDPGPMHLLRDIEQDMGASIPWSWCGHRQDRDRTTQDIGDVTCKDCLARRVEQATIDAGKAKERLEGLESGA